MSKKAFQENPQIIIRLEAILSLENSAKVIAG